MLLRSVYDNGLSYAVAGVWKRPIVTGNAVSLVKHMHNHRVFVAAGVVKFCCCLLAGYIGMFASLGYHGHIVAPFIVHCIDHCTSCTLWLIPNKRYFVLYYRLGFVSMCVHTVRDKF